MKPALRLCAAPRSVSDATRFTATTLHASSKNATPPPRFTPSKAGPGRLPPNGGSGKPGGPGGPATMFETPEQKVARLRAAHERAKAAQVSKFDRMVDASRKVFDSAHKVTVAGLIGFTVLAGLLTAYTAVDMIMYNKKRSAEWAEAQKKLEADSLEAARIAYMTGRADEEQIALVEEQLERERESGRKTSFFNNASVLSTPENTATTPSSAAATATESQPPSAQSPSEQQPQQTDQQQRQKTSLWSWLTSNLKTEEEPLPPSTPSTLDNNVVRAVEERQAQLQAKAQAALERERENQRQGGPLDRVGLAAGEKGEKDVSAGEGSAGEGETAKKKKGWLW